MELEIVERIYNARFFLKKKPNNTSKPNAWSRVLLEKLRVNQLAKKFPAFYEPKSILPYSQIPTIWPILGHMNPVQLIYYIKTHNDNPLSTFGVNFEKRIMYTILCTNTNSDTP
jgi:hypothetical protein